MEKILKLGGVPVTELREQYKTPLYVFDEGKIKSRLDEFKTNLVSPDFETEILYASKAFTCKAMIQLIKESGLSLDVVSGGEMFIALQAGMDPAKIHFHGNNKSIDEMQFAVDQKIGTFVVDNIMEARYIVKLMEGKEHKLHVMLRINPGIDAHTHKYIITADIDSKFGISATLKDDIAQLVKTFDDSENIIFDGFHAHIGSQIFDKNAFVAEIEKMCQFMKDMEDGYGIKCSALDLGGGFAARYTDDDAPIPVDEVCETIMSSCGEMKAKYGLAFNKVMIEPGRSIVGEAGSTIYTVGFSKTTPHKKYIFVDGGMGDNIRPALYQAKYDADIANRMDEEKTDMVCVAGKCCESGDVLIEEIALQNSEPGDILVTYTTGAYGYAMSSRYNMIGRPAVVFVENGNSRLVVRREEPQDLISLDI